MLFQSGDISVFETNIRYVGGLLSAFALTGDNLFRDKAAHVADKLLPAFKSPTGIPFALINMRTGVSSIQISHHFKINMKKQELKNSMTVSGAKPSKLRNTTKKIFNYKIKT